MNKVLRTFLLSVIVVATICLILISPSPGAASGGLPDSDGADASGG